MYPAGFEPSIPEIERLQTYALDRAATGTGTGYTYCVELSLIKIGANSVDTRGKSVRWFLRHPVYTFVKVTK